MPDYNYFDINRRTERDPEAFVQQCEREYDNRVRHAAETIAETTATRPIVLLSGPSGSGKTTTAKLVQMKLQAAGIASHVISLDNYFRTVVPEMMEKDTGEIDFESPDCLDLELLSKHMEALVEGKEILVPKFDFRMQARNEAKAVPLHLKKNEVVILEGIHALNPLIRGQGIVDSSVTLYVSARSNIVREGKVLFKGTWIRLIRRLIRDAKFRGADAYFTMSLWANVRRGEKTFISPYKETADIIIDSSMPYEVCALKPYALPLFDRIPTCARTEELMTIAPALEQFFTLDDKLVPHDSILREFIGGGSIKYSH